jgi:hypothetical protein
MMSVNSHITQSQFSALHIIDHFSDKRYFVDDSFQRRLVWGDKQKVKLIETVLMGYPIPEIYLHAQPIDPGELKQRHSVVDGQQRMSCLEQFTNDEWVLEARYLDKANRAEEYSDKRYSELPSKIKSQILQYIFHTLIIDSDVEIADVKKVFKRINETDRSLNLQEIRHAEFDGRFIGLAEDLANNSFWNEYNVFNLNGIRRMIDVEFTTSLLIYLRVGITTDTSAIINRMYDTFNDSYPERGSDKKIITERLMKISKIFKQSPVTAKLFSVPVHLYTLFTSMDVVGHARSITWYAEHLSEFAREYARGKSSKLFDGYRKGAEQRTRSKGSRDLRGDALNKFLIARRT